MAKVLIIDDDEMMCDTKVLDIIIWSLGKLKDKNKTAYNNG